MRAMYELWYRHGTPPWAIGPRKELVDLVEGGILTPCRVIDLGCGLGDNAIFLAKRGFDVTGIDYARSAIENAQAAARAANVNVHFEVDDLTELRGDHGSFDLLVDYGTFDDLGKARRQEYLRNVMPLARPGARFLLWCFEWRLSWWERAVSAALPFANVAMEPGSVEADLGDAFDIDVLSRVDSPDRWPRGTTTYLMTRRPRTPQEIDAS